MEVPQYSVPEIRNEATPLHFEPGIHPLTVSEHNKNYQDFNNGDLDAHGWNKEVGERVASYAYDAPALLLTLEGLEPQPQSTYSRFTPFQEAVYTWVDLPARPRKLNHTSKVYVVKGDSDYLVLPQALYPSISEPTKIQQQMETQLRTDAQHADGTLKAVLVGETAGIALTMAGIYKLLSLSVPKQNLSRRKFLKTAMSATAGITAAGSLSRLVLPNVAATVAHEPTEEFLQTVTNSIRPRLARSTFVDGRTALLLAKAEDAQLVSGELSQAKNVVLMGSAHLDIVPTYMQNKAERNKAIAAYTQELLDIAKQVYGDYYHISPDQMPSHVTQSVLNYVSQVDIVEVTDPGGPSFQPSFPSTVERYITPYKSFKSPQVEEAIKDLRP